MSRSRSDVRTTPDARGGHAAPGGPRRLRRDHRHRTTITQPALGVVGWLRWGWRQLTSMRTALVLLLLLAIAAVPGSIVPQRSADPNGVTQYFADNPDLAPILDNLSCSTCTRRLVLGDLHPAVRLAHRLRHPAHQAPLEGAARAAAAHARAPRSARRLPRSTVDLDSGAGCRVPDGAAPRRRYRDRGRRGPAEARAATGSSATTPAATLSVSAERGYVRETGNLVFHTALIGVLLAVGIGGGFTYTGQGVIIEGGTFVNTMLDYTSFNPGRFVDEEKLTPYSLTLDEFSVTYQPSGTQGAGPGRRLHRASDNPERGRGARAGRGARQPPARHGGRPHLPHGQRLRADDHDQGCRRHVVFSESVPFLPQDTNMTSLGVIKVPDGLPEQLGLVGFFYPTQAPLTTGAFTSAYPALVNPVSHAGRLRGRPRHRRRHAAIGVHPRPDRDDAAHRRARSTSTRSSSRPARPPTCPTATARSRSRTSRRPVPQGYDESVKRFVSLSIHRDAAATWVLVFAVLAVAGSARRAVRSAPPDVGQGGAASGGRCGSSTPGSPAARIPTLAAALDQVVQRHGAPSSHCCVSSSRSGSAPRPRIEHAPRLAAFAPRRLNPCPVPPRSHSTPSRCCSCGPRSRSTRSRSSRTRSTSHGAVRAPSEAQDAATRERELVSVAAAGAAASVAPSSAGSASARSGMRSGQPRRRSTRRPSRRPRLVWARIGTSLTVLALPLPRRAATSPAASPPVACRGRTCTSSPSPGRCSSSRCTSSSLFRYDLRFLGSFITGLVVLLLGGAALAFYVEIAPLMDPLKSVWLVIHVFVASLATALFALAFGLSVLQLMQARRERKTVAARMRRAIAAGVAGEDRPAVPAHAPRAARRSSRSPTGSRSSASSSGPSRSSPGRSGRTTRGAATGASTRRKSGPSSSGCSTPATSTRARRAAGAGHDRHGCRSSASAAVMFNFTIVNMFFKGLHAYSGLS